MEEENKRLIGRKLYVKWGDGMYIAIEKIPDGSKKLVELDLLGDQGLELCNVYENEKGEKIEESLGTPAMNRSGYEVGYMFTCPEFWMTLGEVESANQQQGEMPYD